MPVEAAVPFLNDTHKKLIILKDLNRSKLVKLSIVATN